MEAFFITNSICLMLIKKKTNMLNFKFKGLVFFIFFEFIMISIMITNLKNFIALCDYGSFFYNKQHLFNVN